MKHYSENEYIIMLLEEQTGRIQNLERKVGLLESKNSFRSMGKKHANLALQDTQVTGRHTSKKDN
jgi:hypothetical protein